MLVLLSDSIRPKWRWIHAQARYHRCSDEATIVAGRASIQLAAKVAYCKMSNDDAKRLWKTRYR
eukprot:COSAG02_NODE_30354_length_552_cov_7.900662_1_plen_63_part_10